MRASLRNQMAVIGALTLGPPEGMFGLDLMRVAGLRSGALYPALTRLECDGLISGSWDDRSMPRRRRYQLVDPGRRP